MVLDRRSTKEGLKTKIYFIDDNQKIDNSTKALQCHGAMDLHIPHSKGL